MSYTSDKYWRGRRDAVARHGSTDEGVEFQDAVIEKETAKAVLASYHAWKTPQWIPKSQLHKDNEISVEGEVGKLVVKRWFCEDKDLRQ